ncbi:MAG: HNH endonuclease signature motif containing protein [Bacteroidetes bacterium]|nr:HNH endonuclease signature motif containing protein [Bacteroidota bacterium]
MSETEHQIRLATFEWLKRAVDQHGDILSRELLAKGFEFRGERIPLVAPQGIFKPRQCDVPLTITTTADGPYDDGLTSNGLLSYRYRGIDPEHRDNRGLRKAMLEGVPLVYFLGIVKGKYLPVWPVYIVGDEPARLTFTVAADDHIGIDNSINQTAQDPAPRREYITRAVRQRLHQRGFQERVMRAYREHCTICRLKHRELLDAAHIIPDSEPDGDPIVTNGLALCKIHHAAYDKGVLGITPDFEVAIRKDVLIEIDGPMLKHGLVEMHGVKLFLPHSKCDWPDKERLERRFNSFLG